VPSGSIPPAVPIKAHAKACCQRLQPALCCGTLFVLDKLPFAPFWMAVCLTQTITRTNTIVDAMPWMHTWLKKFHLTVSFAGSFFSSLPWYNFSAVVPLLVKEFALSASQIRVIISAFQIGYVLIVLFTSWLSDAIGPKRVTQASHCGSHSPCRHLFHSVCLVYQQLYQYPGSVSFVGLGHRGHLCVGHGPFEPMVHCQRAGPGPQSSHRGHSPGRCGKLPT
jgi:hypothetical protein